jgi:hypothetical protein
MSTNCYYILYIFRERAGQMLKFSCLTPKMEHARTFMYDDSTDWQSPSCLFNDAVTNKTAVRRRQEDLRARMN